MSEMYSHSGHDADSPMLGSRENGATERVRQSGPRDGVKGWGYSAKESTPASTATPTPIPLIDPKFFSAPLVPVCVAVAVPV